MLMQLPISRLTGTTFPAIPDAHASTQLALQYQLESSQWWDAEVLLEHQLRQLQSLLRHAAASVPYYQDLFRQHGLIIPDQLMAEFIQQIPISTRSAIQHAGNHIESTGLPADHGTPTFATTSGSTGRPVRFAQTALTRTLWLAFGLRDHLWHARDFSGKLCAIRWFPKDVAEAPAGVQQPNWGDIVAPIFASGPSASLNIVASMEQQIDWLMNEQPDYLLAYPSNLGALAQYASERGISLPRVREVRTIGESASDQERSLIQQAWQAEVVDIYSCNEAGYLALQCPESGHYHVQSENVMLEIVDEAGRPCPPGQTGQVLITTLHNYATPLIRYEIGDMAEFGEPCACGRGLPVIRKIHGRKRNRLVLPSGQCIFPIFSDRGEISVATGVKLFQYQCIQHSLEEIEVKLVMERPLNEAEQATVVSLMQYRLGHPLRIVLSFPAEIPRGPSGKFEVFISKIA